MCFLSNTLAKDDVVHYCSLLDILITHVKRAELFATENPSKLFEGMGMAIPVLHGVIGESGLVENEDADLLFEPENADALIYGLQRLEDGKSLYQRLKNNGPAAANHSDRSALAMKMLRILEAKSLKI